MLPEWDEQAVDLDPKPFWQLLLKGKHRFFRRPLLDESPAVRDPVHVRIHADRRHPARDP